MTVQQKSVHKKSRGRPAGTKYGETIPARLEEATVKRIDRWAERQGVSRSEAFRRLVEIGLDASPRSNSGSSKSTAKS